MLSIVRAILNAITQFLAYSMRLLLWPFLTLTGIFRSGTPEPPGISTFQETLSNLSSAEGSELQKLSSFEPHDKIAENVRELAFLLSMTDPEDRKAADAQLQIGLPAQIRAWLLNQNSDRIEKIATASIGELRALLSNADLRGSAFEKRNSHQLIRIENPTREKPPPYLGVALGGKHSHSLTFEPDHLVPVVTNDTSFRSAENPEGFIASPASTRR